MTSAKDIKARPFQQLPTSYKGLAVSPRALDLKVVNASRAWRSKSGAPEKDASAFSFREITLLSRLNEQTLDSLIMQARRRRRKYFLPKSEEGEVEEKGEKKHWLWLA